MSAQKETIGFSGTGGMGSAMAGHLLKAGYEVHVYTRSREKAQALIEEGGLWESTVKEIAAVCSRIISMVGYPSDVEEVYFGPNGLIENARPGSILVDMTTSRPDLAARIADAAKERGLA